MTKHFMAQPKQLKTFHFFLKFRYMTYVHTSLWLLSEKQAKKCKQSHNIEYSIIGL